MNGDEYETLMQQQVYEFLLSEVKSYLALDKNH